MSDIFGTRHAQETQFKLPEKPHGLKPVMVILALEETILSLHSMF